MSFKPRQSVMKRISIISILLSVLSFNVVTGQEWRGGVGLILSEEYSSPTVIDLDSIVVYEDNLHGGGQLMPAVYYEHPVTPALHVRAGINYYRTGLSLSAFRRTGNPLGPVSKGTVVGMPTFEFPISIDWRIPLLRIMRLHLTGGISVIHHLIVFREKYTGITGNPYFPPSVADVLNAAATLPKTTYMNYYYALGLTYGRMGVEASWHENLSHSTAGSLDLWGEQFSFLRRGETIRLAVMYSFWRKN